MDTEETRLPESTTRQCFNCGKDLASDVKFCPHCAAPLPTLGSGIPMVMRAMGAMVLVGLALILGVAGTCFALVGAMSTPANHNNIAFGLCGLLLIWACVQCFVAMSKLWKGK